MLSLHAEPLSEVQCTLDLNELRHLWYLADAVFFPEQLEVCGQNL